MAITTCVKCNSTMFEAKELNPRNSNFTLMIVQCSLCGGAVAVLDAKNIGSRLAQIEQEMKDRFSNVESNQQRIYSLLQQLKR